MTQTAVDLPKSENFVSEAMICSDDLSDFSEFGWFTPIYIENILKHYYEDQTLQVKSCTVKPASGKGDSFGGILLRCHISYCVKGSVSTTETSLVLKTQIWNEITKNTLKVYDIHNKEMIIYENILPKIRQLLMSINETGDIFPMAIHVDRENDVIIFEDLLLKNYKMENRIQGIGRQHVLMALSKIAKIHAASAVLHDLDSTIYSNLKSGMFTRHTDCYYTFFHTFWSACAEEVSKWKDYEQYGLKLKLMLDDVIENACKMYDKDIGDLHTLTHGDFWLNNIMFNYNEDGSLKDVVVVRSLFVVYQIQTIFI